MPGSLDANFRSGNNNEKAGLALLNSIGAVSPVPREQDFGIDAFVTLLCRGTSRRLIPNATIAVQLKSKSVTSIKLDAAELKWVLSLDMNFFIAHATAGDSTIQLYTINNLLFSTARYSDAVTLVFGRDAKPGELDLGFPIYSWTSSDVCADFLDASCSHLGNWNSTLNQSHELASLGILEQIYWQENCEPLYGYSATVHSPPTEPRVAKHLDMIAHRLAVDACNSGDEELLELVFDIARKLYRFGRKPSGAMLIAMDQHMKNAGLSAIRIQPDGRIDFR